MPPALVVHTLVIISIHSVIYTMIIAIVYIKYYLSLSQNDITIACAITIRVPSDLKINGLKYYSP